MAIFKDNPLPPPEELILPEKTVKITIRLDEESLDFFKRSAKKNKVKYQKMIRDVLRRYSDLYRKYP